MIRLEQVTKRYPGGTVAVAELTLDVADGEVCVLVGPSGCGKTTTMKMINRLVEPTSGRIVLDGVDVTAQDPVELRRHIGYVIQNVGLFPHQTIAANVGTVPRLLGWDRRRIDARVDELLVLVGLEPARYRTRYPHELSGGQQQRVGVARALGADPPVLLMDEPFGAIDPITRDRLQQEFLRLQAEVRKTVVFVTHDIEEAIRLGDRIAVMAVGGHLAQHATPADLLAAPADDFVADFVGADRGLKRLGVTGIPPEAADGAVVVPAATPAPSARARLGEAPGGPALVVDDDGRLLGVLDATAFDGRSAGGPAATAGEAATPVATVTVGATLREALAAMLLDDRGWVALVDADRRPHGVLTADALVRAARLPGDRSGGADGDSPVRT